MKQAQKIKSNTRRDEEKVVKSNYSFESGNRSFTEGDRHYGKINRQLKEGNTGWNRSGCYTAEKSKDVLDDMVKKGELTVEQGKVLNEELKHNLKQTVKNNVNVKVKVTTPEELSELLDKMTPEQLEALKAQIKAKESTVDSEAEEVDAEDTAEDVENVDDAEVVEEETKEE